MNLVRFSPFRELDHVFDRGFGALSAPAAPWFADGRQNWLPAVEVRETEDAYVVDAELPAVEPKDVHVSFHDGVLSISGERRSSSGDEKDRVHRSERRYGKFTRRFTLPADADGDAIRAVAKDGVLTITVDKSEKARPRTVDVQAA